MPRRLQITSLLASCWLCLFLEASNGDEPAKPKPQWERLLTGEDAQQAEDLEKQIRDLDREVRLVEAVEPARKLAVLRERIQGSDHWQTEEAVQTVSSLEQMNKMPRERRQPLVDSLRMLDRSSQLFSKRQFDKAQPEFEKLVAFRRQLLGGDHPITALACNGAAMNLSAQGKHAEAEPLLREVLRIRTKILGNNHPKTAESRSHLAANLVAQSKSAEADSLKSKVQNSGGMR